MLRHLIQLNKLTDTVLTLIYILRHLDLTMLYCASLISLMSPYAQVSIGDEASLLTPDDKGALYIAFSIAPLSPVCAEMDTIR